MKIASCNKQLAAYQDLDQAINNLINEPKRETETEDEYMYRVSKLKIERFEIEGAIISQQFNRDEFVRKNEEYNQKIESLKERIKTEWDPTLIAIKKKMQQRLGQRVPVVDLANALDRADQKFETEEEKLEFFQTLLDFAS